MIMIFDHIKRTFHLRISLNMVGYLKRLLSDKKRNNIFDEGTSLLNIPMSELSHISTNHADLILKLRNYEETD